MAHIVKQVIYTYTYRNVTAVYNNKLILYFPDYQDLTNYTNNKNVLPLYNYTKRVAFEHYVDNLWITTNGDVTGVWNLIQHKNDLSTRSQQKDQDNYNSAP